MADACDICCDKYTAVYRKPVECLYCHYKACLACVKRYLLGTMEEPHCMKCRHGWNREFLDMHLSKTFRTNEYKAHRENILFEREKALLPQTQLLLEERERERALNAEIVRIRQTVSQMQGRIFLLLAERQNLRRQTPINHEALRANSQQRKDINDEIQAHWQTIEELEQKKEIKERKEFIRACPAEGCRGFLSTQWTCGMCKTKVCAKCHDIKQDHQEHTCNEENLLTAQLLSKDTKPCPSCAAQIYKISGCQQMWCTQCHTAFDWKTGAIEKKIHNPHYYEWLRQQNNGAVPREPGDVLCGGLIDLHDLHASVVDLPLTDKQRELLFAMHRMVNHTQHVSTGYFQVRPYHEDNTHLRMWYLNKVINEVEFKRKLQQAEKKVMKMRDVSAVLDMFVNTAAAMFMNFLNQRDFDAFENEYVQLVNYASRAIGVIETRYNCYLTRAIIAHHHDTGRNDFLTRHYGHIN